MKFTYITITLLATILITSCQEGPSTGQKAIRKFHESYSLDQYEKYGYQCSMTGGGGDGERFHLLCIGFNTPEQLDIREARKQIVENVLAYVIEINKNDQFKDFFIEWPFKSEKLEYQIEVDRGDGLWPTFPDGLQKDEKISYVMFYKNTIDYLISTSRGVLPETVHSETLDDAIAILKAEGWTEPEASLDN